MKVRAPNTSSGLQQQASRRGAMRLAKRGGGWVAPGGQACAGPACRMCALEDDGDEGGEPVSHLAGNAAGAGRWLCVSVGLRRWPRRVGRRKHSLRALTRAFTRAVKLVPTTIATARSTTLPRRMKSRKPAKGRGSGGILKCCQKRRRRNRPHAAAAQAGPGPGPL